MECMGSSAAGSQYFPPGFRFHPTDQELIIHYLRNKVTPSNSMVTAIIADVDIYMFNPWDLPDKAFFGEVEWFFFSPRDRKYPNGARPSRGAGCGYWKATGTDEPILASGGSKCLGVKKGLVFYEGRPKGVKTDRIMHEYRLLDHATSSSSLLPPSLKHNKGSSMRLDDWVLCRVRQKGIAAQRSDEKVEANIIIPCSPTDRNIEQLQLQQQQATTTRVKTSNYNNNSSSSSSFCDWSDEQLLDILLLGSQQDDQKEAASGGGDSCHSGLSSPQSSPVPPANGIMPPLLLLLPPEQQVSSVFDDSIKRKLSFGALDELLMLQQQPPPPPSKRLHYSFRYDVGDQSSSHAQSLSCDQGLGFSQFNYVVDR